MPIFLEKFVLPVLVASMVGVILLNPLKFDWQQRIALFLVAIGLAYFCGHTIYLRNQTASNPIQTPSVTPTVSVPSTGNATTSGSDSPAVTGSNNTINSESGSKDVQKEKARPPK